ncbi:MAG TPA: hypothetical protein PLE74_12600 [Candidatus Cloacimonadota bacterium]|nr:hypothetical protein [Candidatus Cloacimonadota bacterium]
MKLKEKSGNILEHSNPYPIQYQSLSNLIPISSDWKGIGMALLFHWFPIGIFYDVL